MKRTQLPGVTLPEVLIVLAIAVIIIVPLFGLMLQTTRVFSNTSDHVGAQLDQTTAFDLMSKDLSEATQCQLQNSGTWVTVIPPMKDTTTNTNQFSTASGVAFVMQDTQHPIHYFLAQKGTGSLTPSATGKALYRAVGSPTGGTFSQSQSRLLLEGATGPLFSMNSADTASRSIIITLTVPIAQVTPSGSSTVNHQLQTQIFMRNISPT